MALSKQVLAIVGAGCVLLGQPAPPAQKAALIGDPVVDTPALIAKGKTAAAGLNHFGLKLLQAEAAAKPHANVFLSPLSIYLALAVTEGGSTGKTRTALRHTLAVPPSLGDDALHEA